MRTLIRADGDPTIGIGHVMRMLALSQHLIDRGADVQLASARLSSALETRAGVEGLSVARAPVEPGSAEDAQWTAATARTGRADWVVLDGYAFKGAFHDAVRAPSGRLMVFDDFGHSDRYAADIVVNQNVFARADTYRGTRAQLLLGTRFVVLRREFDGLPDPRDPRDRPAAARARKLLVTLGGSRQVEVTERFLEAISAMADPELRATVVVGPDGDPPRAPDPRMTVLRGTDDMAGLMREADFALASAGTTTWELARMGVPTLFVILADNQVEVAGATDEHGFGENLGWATSLSKDRLTAALEALAGDSQRRASMSRRGFACVDGQGGARIVDAMMGVGQGARHAGH